MNNVQDKKIDHKIDASVSSERCWYTIHTYAGYEDAVARYLKQRVESLDMHHLIFSIVVPKEKKIKVKGGKRYTIEEKIYPGYVMVEMILNEESWYVVRNTPRVTGFIGADSTLPTPLSEIEANELLGRISPEQPEHLIDLEIGDLVKVIDGPFKDFDGKVSEVDKENAKIKVMVTMFGRETPVELDFLQINKV